MGGTSAAITAHKLRSHTSTEQLEKTVHVIAQGIRSAGHYPPIVMLARHIAAQAPGRKDYLSQLHALFNWFLSHWSYVKDPFGMETVCTTGPAVHRLILGAGTGGKGHGDCDDATVALGAMGLAIGLVPRITIMAAPGKKTASHVYPEFLIGGRWVTADPVAIPKTPFGRAPAAAWRKSYDLLGRPMGGATLGNEEGNSEMLGETNFETWQGVGLEAYGLAGTDGNEPADWSGLIQNYGAFAGTHGIMGGYGLCAEVEPETRDGLARTPMIELSLADYMYVQNHGGRPYIGMTALGDDGTVYQYQDIGFGGFFKKLFRGAKKLVKRAIKGVKKIGRKFIKMLPGGKYLLKLGDKLHKMAMKMVRPLMKLIGPLAKKLAPIAAMIPGYGPVISAALSKVGTITKLVKEFGIMKDEKTGRPKFKSPQQARQFRQALKKQAEQMRRSKEHLKIMKPGYIPKGSPEHRAKLREAGAQEADHATA